jgi:hypothetical protein
MFMAVPKSASAGSDLKRYPLRLKQKRQANLVAESSAHGHANAAYAAAAAEHGCAGLGLHAGAEPVGFHALAAVGLKCALGHGNALLYPLKDLRLDGKIQVYRRLGQESSVNCSEARTWTGQCLVELFSCGAAKAL